MYIIRTYAYAENKPIIGIDLEGLEYFNVSTSDAMAISRAAGSKMYSEKQITEYAKGERKDIMQNGGARTQFMLTAGIGLANPSFGIPLVLGELTGLPISPSPQAFASPTVASEIVGTLTEAAPELQAGNSQIQRNAAQGAAFEQQRVQALEASGNTGVVQQVTIKAGNGVKTKVDAVSFNSSGNIALTEFKSSATAPLTGNQKAAFPSIATQGGVVVGKGKPCVPGGTVIPPTNVDIVRPTAKTQ